MTSPSALAIEPDPPVTRFSLPMLIDSRPGISTGVPGFGIGRASAGPVGGSRVIRPTEMSVVARDPPAQRVARDDALIARIVSEPRADWATVSLAMSWVE